MNRQSLSTLDKGLIITALITLVLWVLPRFVMGATYSKIYEYRDTDGIYDSLIIRTRVGSATRDSVKFLFADSLKDTLTFDQDSTYIEETSVFFTGASMWSSYSSDVLPRWSGGIATTDLSGTGPMIVRALATFSGDTLSGVQFTAKNTSGATEGYLRSGASGVVTFGLDSGTWTFVVEKNGYFDIITDSTISANDTLTFAMSADGAVASPASPALANVYGYLLDITGDPIIGASVTAVRKGSIQITDTTASKNIISNQFDGGSVLTNTSGFFNFYLVRSNYYKKAADGVYEITATKGGTQIFNAVKITVPSTGNLNLGDTLAARL